MADYTSKPRVAKNRSNNAHRPSASDIQARVNLQQIARIFLGEPLYGGGAAVYLIPQFDPDDSEYHIFTNYFRSPVTGDRGGAIRFIQRLRRCNYSHALAYLSGWLDGQQSLSAAVPDAQGAEW